MDWRHRAACLDEDPELFFPIGNTGPALLQIDEAKAVCRRCPVVDTCLKWALESGQDAGRLGRALRGRAPRAQAPHGAPAPRRLTSPHDAPPATRPRCAPRGAPDSPATSRTASPRRARRRDHDAPGAGQGATSSGLVRRSAAASRGPRSRTSMTTCVPPPSRGRHSIGAVAARWSTSVCDDLRARGRCPRRLPGGEAHAVVGHHDPQRLAVAARR